MTETLSSNNVLPEVKALVDALHPLPLSNEETWAIVQKAISGLVLEARVSQKDSAHWRGVANAALDALHLVVNTVPQEIIENNEDVSMAVDYAFYREEEFPCDRK